MAKSDDEPRDAITIGNVDRLRRELAEARKDNKLLRLKVRRLEADIERGRPLTAKEQVENLEDGLGLERGRLTKMLLG